MQIQSNNQTSSGNQSVQSLAFRPTNFNLSENNINAMDMGMDVDSGNQISAFFLLSSTLYKEPYRAIIRELVSNAIDASKQLPIEEQKDVVLHVPSNISNQEFYVQDFGIGMSLEQVINIYGNYFASNKQNDANSIGGFGLGGKTPFIYVKDKTDGFKLETTSPEDGIRRTFVFKMLQNEYGSLKPIYYYLDNLDEANSPTKGTKVSFKLDDEKDIALFAESIGDILFSIYPIQFKGIFELDGVFNNVLQNIENRTKNSFLTYYHYIKEKIANKELIKFNDDFSYINYLIPNKNSCSQIHLLLGNIYYQYSLDKQGGIKTLLPKLNRMNNDILLFNPNHTVATQFPFIQSDCNGKITFSLSREHIQKNENNDQIIQDLVVEHLKNQVVKVNEILINEINKHVLDIKKLYDNKSKNFDNLLLKYDLYNRIDLLKTINSRYSHSLLSKDDLSRLDNMFQELHEIFSDLRSCYYKEKLNIGDIESILKDKYSLINQENNIKNAFEHLSKEIFITLSTTKTFEPALYRKDDYYFLDENFKNSYSNNSYFKILIDDLIKYNLAFAENNYNNFAKESIKLFGEYTKQEAFWYLNLNFNNGFQVSGYTPFENERKLLIFITMDNLSERADYSNEFYDAQTFSWFSKSSRYLKKDNKLTIEGKIAENFYEINVFVKKNNGENFYYLGDVEKVLSAKEIKDSQGKSMVKYIFKLKKDVKKELLDYFNM